MSEVTALGRRLAAAGFIAADDEALELVATAGNDAELLESMVVRRLTGEPLAWITGSVIFAGIPLHIDVGVYVPRWHTERLALRAAEWLPANGVAVDLCTGCGAVARVLVGRHPGARVTATDVDAKAVACARANHVDAHEGDLFAPLPRAVEDQVDVVTAVVPYVPTDELSLLQRDTFTFETTLAYDGGRDGADVLRRVVRDSPRWLRRGGALLLELGGAQSDLLADDLAQAGFSDATTIVDDDGDVRGFEALLA